MEHRLETDGTLRILNEELLVRIMQEIPEDAMIELGENWKKLASFFYLTGMADGMSNKLFDWRNAPQPKE